MVTREQLNQALAKIIAYKNCNQPVKAHEWSKELNKLVSEFLLNV